MAEGVVRVKPGVKFTRIAPAGFRLLSALDEAARVLKHDLTITCACEGHKPTDPHTLGEAYDVRSKNLPPDIKSALLSEVMAGLIEFPEPVVGVSGGMATDKFYGFLEDEGTPNEHFHFQRRKGRVYP